MSNLLTKRIRDTKHNNPKLKRKYLLALSGVIIFILSVCYLFLAPKEFIPKLFALIVGGGMLTCYFVGFPLLLGLSKAVGAGASGSGKVIKDIKENIEKEVLGKPPKK